MLSLRLYAGGLCLGATFLYFREVLLEILKSRSPVGWALAHAD